MRNDPLALTKIKQKLTLSRDPLGQDRAYALGGEVAMLGRAAAVFLTCLLWSGAACTEEISVPVEYHGRQIQLEGQLQMPAGPGPFPVVIALHSCAGYYASQMGPWLELFWQQGYATLRLDSFTARGYTEVCGDPKSVSGAEQGLDALTAAFVLAGRPGVKPDRIAVIGQSHGAGAAIYVARDHAEARPLRAKLAQRGGKLVASVALYGGCTVTRAYPVAVLLLVLVGAEDDWASPGSCLALAKLQPTPLLTVHVYPNAHHSFDIEAAPHYYLSHMLAYDAQATADARSRVVEFLARFLR
jgi:dienelactone hydrolase